MMPRCNHSTFLVFSVAIVLMAKAVASAPTIGAPVARSLLSETKHINDNIHGSRILNTVISSEDSSRQNFESPRTSRTMQRSDSQERYPSPHGKDARWRFDLRHTVEADLSNGVRGSLESIQASSKAAVLRGTILRAHIM
jgi:hypothetical protein